MTKTTKEIAKNIILDSIGNPKKESSTKKTCYVCKQKKSLDGFFKDKYVKKDGHTNYCKECNKEYLKQRKEGKRGSQVVIGSYVVKSYDKAALRAS